MSILFKKSKNLNDMEESNKPIYYILKKNYENFGTESIRNNDGQTVAKVKFPLYSSSHIVEIQDLIQQSTYFIDIAKGFLTKNYHFRDSSNNILAKIKNKPLLSTNKAYLLILKAIKKISTIGKLKKWNYKLINKNNQVIGNVIDLKNSELKILNDNEQEHYYCLRLRKLKEYSIIILGFVICINNVYPKGISNIAGFERRIARLRPFGPGKMKNE